MMSQPQSSGHLHEASCRRLIYVIGTYPGLTTTFIDREITMLRRWGIDLRIVAIRRPPASVPLSQDQQVLQQGVIYLLPPARRGLVLSQLYFILFHPWRYLVTVLYLLTRPHPSRRARWMTLLHFGEGVYAAYLVRKLHGEALHAHFVERAATVVLVMSRLLGRPYSLSIHAGPDLFVAPVLLYEKIRHASHVVTCTAYNKRQVEAIIGAELSNKISAVHHGLHLERYQAARVLPQPRPMLLAVGQLTARKGFTDLIAACRCLRDRGYDFVCHIVGHGPLHDTLAQLIRRLELEETVVLCGPLPHEAVIEKYRSATIFVLPCLRSSDGDMDGLPNVLGEAMAMRLPVISTAISAIPELIDDGVNGLLIPSGDQAALVMALARLLDDPLLRVSLGERARQTVIERFDARRNVWRLATTLWPAWFKESVDGRAVPTPDAAPGQIARLAPGAWDTAAGVERVERW